MSGEDAVLHRLRSLLALVKLQIECGDAARADLLTELDEAIELLVQADGPSPLDTEAGDRKPVAVVVVDDDPRVADILARRLAREGLLSRAVYSLQALVADGVKDDEVVILDLSAVEGADPTQRRRAAAARPLVVTGAVLSEAAPLLAEVGPFAVLQKPFSSERLAALVRRRAAEGAAGK